MLNRSVTHPDSLFQSHAGPGCRIPNLHVDIPEGHPEEISLVHPGMCFSEEIKMELS